MKFSSFTFYFFVQKFSFAHWVKLGRKLSKSSVFFWWNNGQRYLSRTRDTQSNFPARKSLCPLS